MNNAKKKIVMVLLVAIMMIGSFTTTLAASTDNDVKLSAEDKKEIRASLEELGVEKKVQNKLMKKLENGEMWDCMDKEQVAQIPEGYFNVSIEEPVKRYVFPDGSVIETKLEFDEAIKVVKEPQKESGISLYGTISDGTVSSGSGYTSYKGVKVSTKKGFLGMGFYADYTLVNGEYDVIDRVYDHWMKLIGGSISDITLTKDLKEDLNGPAYVKLSGQTNYTVPFPTSATEWLKLHVGNDSAWTSEN